MLPRQRQDEDSLACNSGLMVHDVMFALGIAT